MKRIKRLVAIKSAVCAVSILAMLAFQTTTTGKLAANKLAANHLSPFSAAANSAAANKLAGDSIVDRRIGPDRYTLNARTTSDFLATNEGREVLSYIVGCALPDGVIVQAAAPDGSLFEFAGETGLAKEWLYHRLFKSGRGWVSACLFARVNDFGVALPISLRGPHPALATTQDEETGWTLEEGAFYGDYFVTPGEPVQWIACQGRDQAAGEPGGLSERDCTEPDPVDPTHTKCGFIYAGYCGDFAAEPVCRRALFHEFYGACRDNPDAEPNSDVFRQVITVFTVN